MASVVANNVKITNLESRAVIGSDPEVQHARAGDIDEPAETKCPVVQIARCADKRRGVTSQPVGNGREIIAALNKLRGDEYPGRRAKAIDLNVDAVQRIARSINRNRIRSALPILAQKASAGNGLRTVDRTADRHVNDPQPATAGQAEHRTKPSQSFAGGR